jgi:hypothetical protein
MPLLEECYVLRYHRLTCCDVRVCSFKVVRDDSQYIRVVTGCADNEVADSMSEAALAMLA